MKAGTLGNGGTPFGYDGTVLSSHLILPTIRTVSKRNRSSDFNARAVLQNLFQLEDLDSSEAKARLENLGNPHFAEQIRSISQEKNQHNLYHGLLVMARELKSEGKPGCVLLYDFLKDLEGFSNIAEPARKELLALRGEGAWGPRVAIFAQQALEQNLDVPSLLAMIGGGLGYRVLKGGLAGWLLASPASMQGARFVAATVGIHGTALLGEAAIFNSTLKLSEAAMGRSPNFDHWGRDWTSLAVFLGTLRGSRYLLGQTGQGLMRAGLVNKASPLLMEQLGLYLGILAGHRLQGALDLDLGDSKTNPWGRAFTEWMHFNAASFVSARLTPRKLRDLEQRLDAGTDAAFNKGLRNFFDPPVSGSGLDPLLAVAGSGSPRLEPGKEVYGESPWSSMHAEVPQFSFSKGVPRGEVSPRHRMREALGSAATPKVLELADHLDHHLGAEGKFYEALAQSPVKDARRLEIALHRIWHPLRHLDKNKSQRNYADQVALASLLENQARHGSFELGPILKYFGEGGRIQGFEALVQGTLAHQRLVPMPSENSYLSKNMDVVLAIEGVGLSARSRNLLQKYAELSLNPEVVRKVEADKLLKRLDALSKVTVHPVYAEMVEKVFELAEQSPISGQRIGRLLRIAENDTAPLNLASKLRELGDPHFEIIYPHALLGLKVNLSRVDGTQFNAYYDDPSMALLFRNIYWSLRSVLPADKAAARKIKTEEIFEEFWKSRNKEELDVQDFIHLLNKLGDAHSKRVAKDIDPEKGKLMVEFVDDEAFYNRVIGPNKNREVIDTWPALYSPAGLFGSKGLISVRKVQFEPARRNEQLFDLLRSFVHEHRHSKNMVPGQRRDLGDIVKQEVDAHAFEYFWAALHGEPKHLQRTLEWGTGGIALYLRQEKDVVYQNYFGMTSKQAPRE